MNIKVNYIKSEEQLQRYNNQFFTEEQVKELQEK